MIVVYHNAPSADDCGGVQVWEVPPGRSPQQDFVNYPGYHQCGMFRREWMQSLGYKPANVLILEE